MESLSGVTLHRAPPTTSAGAPAGAPAAGAIPRRPSARRRDEPHPVIPVTRVVIAPEPRFGPDAWGVIYDLADPQGKLETIELYSDHPPRDPWGGIDADALLIIVGTALFAPRVPWEADVFASQAPNAPFVAGVRTVIRNHATGEWERVAAYARGVTPVPRPLLEAPVHTLATKIAQLDLEHVELEVRPHAAA